jgi:Holliday junction resolvase RusA-like endonuclease
MEPTTRHGAMAKKKRSGFSPCYRIRCHTRAKRLGDCDGRSIKAILDGIVQAGILPDDSAKFVKEVVFTQELGTPDETIITIEEIEPWAK